MASKDPVIAALLHNLEALEHSISLDADTSTHTRTHTHAPTGGFEGHGSQAQHASDAAVEESFITADHRAARGSIDPGNRLEMRTHSPGCARVCVGVRVGVRMSEGGGEDEGVGESEGGVGVGGQASRAESRYDTESIGDSVDVVNDEHDVYVRMHADGTGGMRSAVADTPVAQAMRAESRGTTPGSAPTHVSAEAHAVAPASTGQAAVPPPQSRASTISYFGSDDGLRRSIDTSAFTEASRPEANVSASISTAFDAAMTKLASIGHRSSYSHEVDIARKTSYMSNGPVLSDHAARLPTPRRPADWLRTDAPAQAAAPRQAFSRRDPQMHSARAALRELSYASDASYSRNNRSTLSPWQSAHTTPSGAPSRASGSPSSSPPRSHSVGAAQGVPAQSSVAKAVNPASGTNRSLSVTILAASYSQDNLPAVLQPSLIADGGEDGHDEAGRGTPLATSLDSTADSEVAIQAVLAKARECIRRAALGDTITSRIGSCFAESSPFTHDLPQHAADAEPETTTCISERKPSVVDTQGKAGTPPTVKSAATEAAAEQAQTRIHPEPALRAPLLDLAHAHDLSTTADSYSTNPSTHSDAVNLSIRKLQQLRDAVQAAVGPLPDLLGGPARAAYPDTAGSTGSPTLLRAVPKCGSVGSFGRHGILDAPTQASLLDVTTDTHPSAHAGPSLDRLSPTASASHTRAAFEQGIAKSIAMLPKLRMHGETASAAGATSIHGAESSHIHQISTASVVEEENTSLRHTVFALMGRVSQTDAEVERVRCRLEAELEYAVQRTRRDTQKRVLAELNSMLQHPGAGYSPADAFNSYNATDARESVRNVAQEGLQGHAGRSSSGTMTDAVESQLVAIAARIARAEAEARVASASARRLQLERDILARRLQADSQRPLAYDGYADNSDARSCGELHAISLHAPIDQPTASRVADADATMTSITTTISGAARSREFDEGGGQLLAADTRRAEAPLRTPVVVANDSQLRSSVFLQSANSAWRSPPSGGAATQQQRTRAAAASRPPIQPRGTRAVPRPLSSPSNGKPRGSPAGKAPSKFTAPHATSSKSEQDRRAEVDAALAALGIEL